MADYSVDIKIAVKGAKELKAVRQQTTALSKEINNLNRLANKQSKTLPNSFNTLNKVLSKSRNNLNKVAIGTSRYNRAINDLVDKELRLSAATKQRDRDLENARRSKLGMMSLEEREQQLDKRAIKLKTLRAKKEKELKLIEERRNNVRRRSRVIQSAGIGGGFPLLFGGGLGQAIPGLIGGALGEAASPGGGFAGSIAATALVAQLTKIGQASIETAGKLSTLNEKLELARERSLFTSNETEELARQLERQGKAQELNNLLNEEYQKIIGAEGVAKLNKLNEVSSEFGRLMGILKTRFDAFIAGPLTALLKLINRGITNDSIRDQFRKFRSGLRGSQKEFFEEELLKARGGNTRGALSVSVMEKMLERFQVTPDPLSQGKSGKKLTPQAQLAKDRMADLDKEIEKATLKNTLSEREFEIEMRIQEIKKGTLGLDDDEIKAKLEKLYKLDQEQERLQKIKDLYSSIADSIETGIVDALQGAINGTKTLGDVARSVFTQIQRSLLEYGVNSMLSALPGKVGEFFQNRAEGGPVKAGNSYIVGERGPEMFSPGVSGRITPNHALGGSTNIVVNVDASGSSVQSEGDGQQFGEALATAIQLEIAKQKRSGGLLA